MTNKIAVVIPSYKVKKHILDIIQSIDPEISHIYIVDDCCPEKSGEFVKKNCKDQRITVIHHAKNQGVGGAMISGYQAAIEDNMDIIVKIDGDGQMDPHLIPYFTQPIADGEADYTKGNRFYDLEQIKAMPRTRLFGNAILSFMSKISTGYWNLFDPTNGYTAIHRNVAARLPLKKISQRYFFETDILFRLNILRAVVIDIPMDAKYGDESSSLKISNIIGEFFFKHLRNSIKRIFYNYYLRDLSLASIELIVGIGLFIFGAAYGGYNWFISAQAGVQTPAGTVMLAALPIIMGIQFILAFIGYDISTIPSRPISRGPKPARINTKSNTV